MIKTLLNTLSMGVVLWAALPFQAMAAPTSRPESGPPLAWPTARPPQGMSLHALMTGKMVSRAALAYSGGALADERIFGQGAILVRHPGGNLLFDSGFGQDVDAHFRSTPWLMQMATRYEKLKPVKAQLAEAGLAPSQLKAIVLTHAHWDHVSGLDDLPGVPVWTTPQELVFIRSGNASTELARQFGLQRYQAFKDGLNNAVSAVADRSNGQTSFRSRVVAPI